MREEQVVWDDIIAENIYVICNTPMAVGITKRTLCGFREDSAKKAHIKNDQLIEKAKNNQQALVDEIKSEGFWKNNNSKNMIKFNAIVGNPPYDEKDGSGASDDASNPLYQLFVETGKLINAKHLSLIIPSKWMVGGKPILKAFRKSMMEDKHIVEFIDHEDSAACFDGQHIDGGICYFLRTSSYNGLTNYTYITKDGEKNTSIRSLSYGESDIVVRDSRRQSILAKATKDNESLEKIVSKTRPFGIRKDLFNSPERYPIANLQDTPFDSSILIYGVKGIKGGAKRTKGYIKREVVSKNVEAVDKYKIFFTTSFSSDAITPPQPIMANPGEACTETFLLVGPFTTKNEQMNCGKFFDTKFFKILLFFGRGTMQVSPSSFRFIPLQDFTDQSDIDWTQPVEDIDQQLSRKYGLTEDEQQFIETMIKPMK